MAHLVMGWHAPSSWDAQLSLVDDMLHYFDRTSMANSLEVRVPFLDHRLVELCARMPVSLKLSGTTTKAILRSAARGLVPEAVLNRPKVGFFSSAVGHWFDQQIGGEIVDRLLDPAARFAPTSIRRRSSSCFGAGGAIGAPSCSSRC
jgi:Asparagine synthase (glutamine-hydrolyzing)